MKHGIEKQRLLYILSAHNTVAQEKCVCDFYIQEAHITMSEY